MNCECITNCDTVQILEPRDDLLVDTAGSTSDMDERGQVELQDGQTVVIVYFQVPKINNLYNFEYLYVDAMLNQQPGAIQVVPNIRAREGFAALFAGSPIGPGYVLHWRVTVVRTTTPDLVDAPEDILIQIPRQKSFLINFAHPRSNTGYGFTELTVQNLADPANSQTPIHVQVSSKSFLHFGVAVNPIPPNNNYYLRVRTP